MEYEACEENRQSSISGAQRAKNWIASEGLSRVVREPFCKASRRVVGRPTLNQSLSDPSPSLKRRAGRCEAAKPDSETRVDTLEDGCLVRLRVDWSACARQQTIRNLDGLSTI